MDGAYLIGIVVDKTDAGRGRPDGESDTANGQDDTPAKEQSGWFMRGYPSAAKVALLPARLGVDPMILPDSSDFREGFCWSDINTTYLKCRKKQKSINDVKSMSLYSGTKTIPEYFFICIINSSFMSYYVDDFVNNTQTFQINDARQLPIVIPTEKQLKKFGDMFASAVLTKEKQFSGKSFVEKAETELATIQAELDEMVAELYGIV